MKVALVLGKKQGDAVKPRLLGIKDNLNIDIFDTIPEFIDNALKRNAIYDRILVTSSKCSERTMQDLKSYWDSTSKETQVVMLAKSNADETKAKIFLDIFLSPVAAVMLLPSTTVQILSEAVLRPTMELTKDYGIKDFLDVELDDDLAYIPEQPKKEVVKEQVSENSVQVQQQNNQKPAQNNTNQKQSKEKKGLFGGLFGGKKKKNGVQNQQSQVNPQNNQNLNNQNIQQDYNEQQVDQFSQQDYNYQQDFNNTQANNYNQQGYTTQQNFENYDNQNDYVSSEDYNQDNYNYDNSYNSTNYNGQQEQDYQQPVNQQYTEQQLYQQSQYQNQDYYENSNVNYNDSSLNVDVSFESDFEETEPQVNDFEPETRNQGVVENDVDLSDETVEETEEVHYRMPNASETDENFGALNVAGDEDIYRQQADAQKVVTKTVVKEVVRNVNTGGKLVALQGVYTGRLKKIVVVTGDRGSGVTSTALNIAKTLSKKVDVLYFDCDIDNHGLLNYIDYSNFKNYEPTHMNGVKLCKSSQVFDSCVISWDENFYLLTTDFSCDCSDEALKATSEVVAERADDFGVVIVDCPVGKLHLITDLILTGQAVICVEGSKRGFMNMLCQFEASSLAMRYKRTLVSRGLMFITKCNKHLDLNKLINYIKAIYEPDEVNWLAPKSVAFDGKLTDSLLNDILEG